MTSVFLLLLWLPLYVPILFSVWVLPGVVALGGAPWGALALHSGWGLGVGVGDGFLEPDACGPRLFLDPGTETGSNCISVLCGTLVQTTLKDKTVSLWCCPDSEPSHSWEALCFLGLGLRAPFAVLSIKDESQFMDSCGSQPAALARLLKDAWFLRTLQRLGPPGPDSPCMFVDRVHAQSCPALCGPMDCSPAGFSVHGILQARILEWVAVPSYRASSQPRHASPLRLQHCRWILFLLSHWDRYPICNNHLPCACLGQGRGLLRARDPSPSSAILCISSGDGTSPSGMWPIPRSLWRGETHFVLGQGGWRQALIQESLRDPGVKDGRGSVGRQGRKEKL